MTETRSILVEHSDGSATIIKKIPDNAKITYGPVSPGKMTYGSGHALRIYTSANNQLAVFKDVESFRDLSLEVLVREVTVNTNTEDTFGANGRSHKHDSRTVGEFVRKEDF